MPGGCTKDQLAESKRIKKRKSTVRDKKWFDVVWF